MQIGFTKLLRRLEIRIGYECRTNHRHERNPAASLAAMPDKAVIIDLCTGEGGCVETKRRIHPDRYTHKIRIYISPLVRIALGKDSRTGTMDADPY